MDNHVAREMLKVQNADSSKNHFMSTLNKTRPPVDTENHDVEFPMVGSKICSVEDSLKGSLKKMNLTQEEQISALQIDLFNVKS